jgi:probable HAF family extracellular repeat protein
LSLTPVAAPHYACIALTQLSALGQDSAAASSINSNGEIAGTAENGETDPLYAGFPELRAVLWKGRQITDLGTFGGTESYLGSVNDRGEVSGAALNTTPDPYSFIGLFGQNGNANQTQTHAFVWKNGGMTDIGTLGGPDSGCCTSGAVRS